MTLYDDEERAAQAARADIDRVNQQVKQEQEAAKAKEREKQLEEEKAAAQREADKKGDSGVPIF